MKLAQRKYKSLLHFEVYFGESTESIRVRRNVRKPMVNLLIACYLCDRTWKQEEKRHRFFFFFDNCVFVCVTF